MRLRTVVACLLVTGGVAVGVTPATAATVSSGSCTSTVGNATNVSMSVDADGTCILQFKNVGSTTWGVPAGITSAEVFIVGGGGGAAAYAYRSGHGGSGIVIVRFG
ncbi:MAG: hypothetical protein ACKORY_05725, partial [Actinomycetota bacterium]